MYKYCPECGNSLEPNVKFCPECGKKLENNIEKSIKKVPITEGIKPRENGNQDYQYNNIDNLIEPINSKKDNFNNKRKYEESFTFKPEKKKSGCLKKIVGLIVTVCLIFFAIGIFVGNDNDNISGKDLDTYEILDEITGLDFYNIEVIPCIETEDEFNEVYIPYITRGIAEKFREVEYFGDIIFSDSYMDAHSDEEWLNAVGEYSEMWAEVEYYSKTFERMLKETDFSDSSTGIMSRFSAEFFVKVYADDKVDWDEVGMYLKQAESSKVDPITMLVHNIGVSAEKAKKIARTYWYQDTRQELNIKLDKEVRKSVYKERMLKAINYTGKGASVIASIGSFGTLNIINQVGVFLCTTDTIVDMGEQTSTYLFGKKNNVLSAYLLHLREKVTSKAGMFGSILSLNPANLKNNVKLFDRSVELFNSLKFGYDTVDGLNQGKFLGFDISSDEPKTFVAKDKEELENQLREKGVNISKKTISAEDYEKMKNDNSWLEADEETRSIYMGMRDLERAKEKENTDEKEGKKLSDEAIRLYDEKIAGTDAEPKIDINIKGKTIGNSDEDDNVVDQDEDDNVVDLDEDDNVVDQDEDDNVVDQDEDDNVVDLDEDDNVVDQDEDDNVVDQDEDNNVVDLDVNNNDDDPVDAYDDIEDNSNSDIEDNQSSSLEFIPMDLINNDPLSKRVWQRLESMNTIEDDVIDELMSDIVWNISVSQTGRISLDDMKRIFKERSSTLYTKFQDLFYEEDVPSSSIVEDNDQNGDDNSNSSYDDNQNYDNNDSGSNDSGDSGIPPKAEKEFMEFQEAQKKYESLPDGPEKQEAYRVMSMKYQLYMEALKR